MDLSRIAQSKRRIEAITDSYSVPLHFDRTFSPGNLCSVLFLFIYHVRVHTSDEENLV